MFDFLQGWRRKAGCVLLVMAWVLSIGWIRSFTTADIVVVPPITTISGNGELDVGYASSSSLFWGTGAFRFGNGNPNGRRKLWAVESNGVTGGYMIQSDTIANIDYFYIVIPLTALSAWLLMLRKPRGQYQQNQKPQRSGTQI